MSEELKACPFCGQLPMTWETRAGDKYAECATTSCVLCIAELEMTVEAWNRRSSGSLGSPTTPTETPHE